MYSTGCNWQKECSYTRYRMGMTRSYTISYTRFLVLKYTQIKESGKGEVSYLGQHNYREKTIFDVIDNGARICMCRCDETPSSLFWKRANL